MNKRLLLLWLAALALPAFTLGAGNQVARLRWVSMSEPIGSTATINSDFAGTMTASVSPFGGVSYGQAAFRMGGMACRFSATGSTDGGTNDLIMEVLHEDAGVDCLCDMGAGSCTDGGELACDCPSGMTQLTGSTWKVRIAPSSTCLTQPASLFCSIDLFR